MKQYKIGEIAKILGTTTQTLRFYEQEGVIEPQKTENGTRYFTAPDIIRLMAFKRFRLSDFTVQDVAQHFKYGTLDTLVDQLSVQSDALMAQSELLVRRAQAVRRFEDVLRGAQEHLDKLMCIERPEIYTHECTLGELDSLNEAQHASFAAFMEAMPDTHICFLYDITKKTLDFHFAVSKEKVAWWSLPLNNTVLHPAGRCVRIFVRTDSTLWSDEYLQSQIQRVKEAGYQIDPAHPLIGQQLASEHAIKDGKLIAALYVPVL